VRYKSQDQRSEKAKDKKDRHACKGQNSCKGRGGCAIDGPEKPDWLGNCYLALFPGPYDKYQRISRLKVSMR
jgi:hypothetical protein